jgi:L-amino acid N-acyltransferase YncA
MSVQQAATRAIVAIEPMQPSDWPAVRRIHGEGIATGVATLDPESPGWQRWDAAHRPDCRFVARLDGDVVGWTALSPYSARPVYAGVAWESVYVGRGVRRVGVGRALLETIVAASEEAGVWTLLAGILADNRPSLTLHRRVGFREIGVNRRLGRDREGRWRDVVLMERRSEVVGRD